MIKKIVLVATLVMLPAGLFVILRNNTVTNDPPVTPMVSDTGTKVAHSNTDIVATSTLTNAGNDTQPQSQTIQSAPARHSEIIINDRQFTADGQTYPLLAYSTLASANDPSANQWWVAQSNLASAWDAGTGSGATIAVIDTGFALQHEEFSDRWLTNSGEKGATTIEAGSITCTSRGLVLDKSCNGVDDDKNGYIDDYMGWDFANNDASVQAGEESPGSSNAFHGTAVTGIAAATANNQKGIAGVSWGAKILPLQAMDDQGDGDTLSIARAIRYAADRNIDVVNLSLGGPTADQYLRQAIQYALDRDTIVVAAAGNDGCDCMVYPANYPEVVSVGAYSQAFERASFSSYGTNLDILAPGSGMISPSWSTSNSTSHYASQLAGTSFAAPVISGLLANARAANPTMTWGQLVTILMQTADHRSVPPHQPRSNQTGFGFSRAGEYSNRLSNGVYATGRYYLHIPITDLYGSASVHDCQTSDYPGVQLYVITENSVPSYSVSELAVAKARARGATITARSFVCMGTSKDTAGFNRLLEPLHEFSNYY